jgi:two-component sensor histidine kinase
MTAAEKTVPERARCSQRILLIEDEEAHANIVERSFQRSGWCHLTIVPTIAEGAREIASSPYSLVISDWQLPDGDAFDLLTGGRRFPLLIMTSHGNEKVAVAAMRAGALDYVVKSENSLRDMPRLAEGAIRLWTNILDKELAQEKLRRALDEKTLLLKEVHHRVKNNLQVVCSLLSMQIESVEGGQTGTHAIGPLREAHSRVVAMSLIHEHISQSDSLADLDFGRYVEVLSRGLFQAYCVDSSRLQLELNVEPNHLSVDEAVPCGLILNELLSNSLKHGFPDGRQGVIQVSFLRTGDRRVELSVSDNGVGLPAGLRWEESPSLGLQVVRALAHQLRAELSVVRGGGTSIRLNWEVLPKP